MVSVVSEGASGSGKAHSSKAESNLESFYCRVDDALNLDSFNVKGWLGLGDESICGSEKWWDDDNTLATTYTAFTACTACTDYTGFTGCTDYTGYTSNTGYCTTSTQGTYATRDERISSEKDDDATKSREEIRDDTEASGGLTDDDLSDDATAIAANQLTENNNISAESNTEEENAIPPIDMMPIVPPTAIEFNANEGTIRPATGTSTEVDYSSSPAHVLPTTSNLPAIAVTVADYSKNSNWGIRVKGLRKQRHRKAKSLFQEALFLHERQFQ